jgi:hypothetical protein
MPLYRTDPVKTSLFPTDRAERDPVTGMAVSIGFTPIRGRGIQIQTGMGEQFKPLTYDKRIPSRDIQQGELSGLDADTVDGKHAADFADAFHTHPLTHITQSGASSNQVPKWNAASSVWQPGNVDWTEITGKPTTFPPSPHTHTLGDLQRSGASTNQVPKWSGTAWVPGNVDWAEVTNKPSTFPPSAHASSHAAGGSDALTGNLDANARVGIMNSGTLVGTRRRVNFVAGENVTLNVVDDATNEKVDVTINAQGGGELFATATAPPQTIPSGSHFVLARLTVPTAKPNLKVVAVAVSPFYGMGVPMNARIELFNETDNVSVAIWTGVVGPVYVEPNQVFALGGKTVSFRLSHGAPGPQECWGSVSFKLTS